MARYEAVVDEEGRIRLPAELSSEVGARPGDRLDVSALGSMRGAFARSLSIQVFGNRMPGAARDEGADGDLGALRVVARRAREDGAAPSEAADPIGDFLVEEDMRSRRR